MVKLALGGSGPILTGLVWFLYHLESTKAEKNQLERIDESLKTQLDGVDHRLRKTTKTVNRAQFVAETTDRIVKVVEVVG